ncbi:4-hydroxyphenylpyruvate dioxygenase [Corallococcus praedator]|uniref:4-hydroxyphenylpyruvate dioxygenase n=1 Tax=Corallococcus praedator TaxID=2316724 RepID=A0ABX9QFT4_9BACT|nr:MULTISPECIES: 4-hydroxyphenylpyruvate dioxygenase [Corallococcus]RKH26389.1 4-hydroxyphenylpyruvate dioxygenase [Corallococcus sp. CA031C]RKI06014.1 4-hydroxyphenylpyruvate dioxygenase [Corallococcus praedator]
MHFDDIEYVELCVADVSTASGFYTGLLGFRRVAEGGPETGLVGRRSVLLQQGTLRLLLTQGLEAGDAPSTFVERHGDGVRDIALRTKDAVAAFGHVTQRGAQPLREPVAGKDGAGRRMFQATVATVGDLVHSIIQSDAPVGTFLPPGLVPCESPVLLDSEPFSGLDHLAICLEPGTLDATVRFYEHVFGFRQSHQEVVHTAASGMNSKVVQSPSTRICFPLQEPLSTQNPGQIGEFLRRHGGPGVQHLALLTSDIVGCVRQLQQGLSFLEIPPAYYERLESRLGALAFDMEPLRELGILVDRDEWGTLLQTFTRSAHPRQTLFFEAIQRQEARGFGGANIRALFEAVERDYARVQA